MYVGYRLYRRENTHSASTKNNMEFMNNIGAHRQVAKDRWKPAWGGGGERKRLETKEERHESHWCTVSVSDWDFVYCWMLMLIKQKCGGHDIVKIRRLGGRMWKNTWPSSEWHHQESHTCKTPVCDHYPSGRHRLHHRNMAASLFNKRGGCCL